MEEKGLVEVLNPSALFLGEAKKGVPGSVVTAVMEGTRPLMVEIQALVVPTKLAFPKRLGSGVDQRRLEVIVAVLTRRVGLALWDYDIFVNAAGGIRVGEPAADLAIALALASSFLGKPLAADVFAVGEIGLLGEIRDVLWLEKRVKEARRLGLRTPITKREARTVGEAIRKFLSTAKAK
jgi:DNA repair protein RadA/Sms